MYSGLELIGDGLIKLPFVRALRKAWPRARITWLAGYGRTVFADSLAEIVSPYLDEVLNAAGVGNDWKELVIRPLPGRRFDLIIDTQRRVKTTLILRRIDHGVFVSGAAGFWLSDLKPEKPYRRSRRLVDELLKLVELASGQPSECDRNLVLPSPYGQAADIALPGGPYLGLAPGAGGAHKRWPFDRFTHVAGAMREKGYRPAFFLGPSEAAWTDMVRAACPAALLPLQDRSVDADLSRSPLFTIACAQRLSAAVANDSGAGHLFAAADVPLLSLFGPTSPAKFAPVLTHGEVIRAQDFGGDDMSLITAESVVAALCRIADQGASKSLTPSASRSST